MQLCIFVFQVLLSIGESLQTASGQNLLTGRLPCSACHIALNQVESFGSFKFWTERLVLCSRFAVEVSSACRLSSASLPGPSSQLRGPPDAHPPFCLEAGSWALVELMLSVSVPCKKGTSALAC